MNRRTLVTQWAAHKRAQDNFLRWVESWVVWQQMTGQWSVDMRRTAS